MAELDRREAHARAERAAASGVLLPPDDAVVAAKGIAANRRAASDAAKHGVNLLNAEISVLRDQGKGPFWLRWRGHAERDSRIQALTAERDKLWVNWSGLQKMALSAAGCLREAEVHHSVEVATRETEAAERINLADSVIARVGLTRQLLSSCPAVGYCGPAFCERVVAMVEHSRKKLRDPFARTMWGLPVRGPGEM